VGSIFFYGQTKRSPYYTTCPGERKEPLPLRIYLLALAAFLFVLDVFLRRVSLKESGKE
jgi:hypothetical protein